MTKFSSLQNISRRVFLQGSALLGATLLVQPQSALASLAPKATVHTQTRLLLGTFVTLSAVHESKTRAEEALGRAFETIVALEADLTRHKSSPLTELNTQGKLLNAPQSLVHVLQNAQRVHSLTSGAFDVTVAPLLQVYDKAKNPSGSMRIDTADVRAARELMQAQEVHLSPDHVRLGRTGMALTLDGIAKGYIADMASATLTKHGVTHHLVNAGGDIRTSGQKAAQSPWRVAIENPARTGETLTSLDLNGAIATSGNYEMFYDAQKKYHHLIDPKHAQSTKYSTSVTVTAPTTLEADALATALSAMPTHTALELVNSLPGRECLIIAGKQVLTSRTWGKA